MYHSDSPNFTLSIKEIFGALVAFIIIFVVGNGLFSFSKQVYKERQLLATPVIGTIVSCKEDTRYYNSIRDIYVDFDYEGKTYSLHEPGRKSHGISKDYSTITVYVYPEDPNKSQVHRDLAGWETLFVTCTAWTMWLSVVIFLSGRMIRGIRNTA